MDPDNDPNIQHPRAAARRRAARRRLRRPRGAPRRAPARRTSCTSASTAPASWSTRSTGRRKGPRHWRIVLRCPECESRREGVFDQTVRGTARRRARPRLERAARRPAAHDAREHVRGNRVLRARARRRPDHSRATSSALSGSARRPRRRPARAAPSDRPAAIVRQRRLGLGDDRQRPLAGLVERAGGGDPLAQRLRLLGARPQRAPGRRRPARGRARARGSAAA